MSIEDAFISYDRVVHQSGSASLLALGMAVVLLGIVSGWTSASAMGRSFPQVRATLLELVANDGLPADGRPALSHLSR